MKNMFLRISLFWVLLLLLIPIQAQAEENSVTFSTFDELQQLIMTGPNDGIDVWYTGSGPLLIEEDTIIPAGFYIYDMHEASNQAFIVPEDVTLTIDSVALLGKVTVEGTIQITSNGTLNVYHTLSITGSIINEGSLCMSHQIRSEALPVLVGADKITDSGKEFSLTWLYIPSDTAELQACLDHIAAYNDSRWSHILQIGMDENIGTAAINITITESFLLPENTGINFDGAVTIAEGCTVKTDGYCSTSGILNVNGTLDAPEIYVWHDREGNYADGGQISVGEKGSVNTQSIIVYSNSLTSPQNALLGMDLSNYYITEGNENDDHYWELTTDAPPTEETEPTTPPIEETKPTTPPVSDNSFVDVATDVYYFEPVQWAVNNGITNGLSADTFGPDATCTRAQIVTFLWRANGSPKPESTNNPFSDVPAGQWYTDAVLWAVEKGITTGTSATTFSPDAGCTRGQVATFLWRSMEMPASVMPVNSFTDIDPNAYYYNAVLWAVENGITNGLSATAFGPDVTCTRGQIVTFLYRNDSVQQHINRYTFHMEDVTWSEANKKAKELGGHLVHLNSIGEMGYLMARIYEMDYEASNYILLGGRRTGDATEYCWVDTDGNPVGGSLNEKSGWENALWLMGEPSLGYAGEWEDVMSMRYSDKDGRWGWNDIPDDLPATLQKNDPSKLGTIVYIVEYED